MQAKKLLKRSLLGAAGLIVLVSLVNLAWMMSGSEEWELEIDKDGVQVYSYKAPGSSLKIFKGVKRAKYTPSHIVGGILLDNPSLQNCKDWIPTCKSLIVLEPYTEQGQGDAVLWTLELLPPLFTDREYALKSYVTQDKYTGKVAINMLAASNKVPLNDCCLRISHMHNRWEITPLGNGEVEIQLTQDHSVGGFFPDLLLNLAGANTTYKLFHEMIPVLLDKQKYRDAKFDYIVDESPAWQTADLGRIGGSPLPIRSLTDSFGVKP